VEVRVQAKEDRVYLRLSKHARIERGHNLESDILQAGLGQSAGLVGFKICKTWK